MKNIKMEDLLASMVYIDKGGDKRLLEKYKHGWFDYCIDNKLSEIEIIEMLVSAIFITGEYKDYRGELYREIKEIIKCGYTKEDMLDLIVRLRYTIHKEYIIEVIKDILKESDINE